MSVPRSIWKGVITFGMVSIPVRLTPATEDKDVSFHLLHEQDHSRIKFKRWCPVDDQEVSNEELVRAYEVSKGQYVEVTDEDLERLPLPSKHTIELSAFVKTDDIDPVYFEKSYFLEPEETGLKPYTLLMRVLQEKDVAGVAKIALRNKEHLCALRPLDGTLLLETLHYPDEIREHEQKLPKVVVSEREIDVAGSLVEALSEDFDPGKYHDDYREALLEVINSKAEGRQVVSPEAPAGARAGHRLDVRAARQRRGRAQGPPWRRAGRSRPSAHQEAQLEAGLESAAQGRAQASSQASQGHRCLSHPGYATPPQQLVLAGAVPP